MSSSPPRPPRSRLLTLRVVGAVIAVLAVLLFLNLIELDGEHRAGLSATGILLPNLDAVLVAERRQTEATAWFEYVLLVTAGVALLIVLAGPRLIRQTSVSSDRDQSTQGSPLSG